MKDPAELTPEQARLLRLALRPSKHLPNANFYIARKGTDEDNQWLILARDGHAAIYRDSTSWRDYRVTDAGKKALGTYDDSQKRRVST